MTAPPPPVELAGLILALQLDRGYESQRAQADLQAHLASLKECFAEFYAAHELTKLIQNTQKLQCVTIWQPCALKNLDYAATNVKLAASRDFDALLPYEDPNPLLQAMQTKQFENLVVLQWETAEDLANDWTGLLMRVKRIQAMLPSGN